MMWWCQKKPQFWWGQKQAKNSHFEPLFRDPQKTAIFDHFSCVDEFWQFHDVLNKFWRWDDGNDVLMMMKMTKKSCSRGKNDEKWPITKPFKKNVKNGARYGRRETAERKSHKERLWRDRVRQYCDDLLNKKKTSPGMARRVRAQRCARRSSTHAQHTSHEWHILHVGLMKTGACERSECVRVSQKSVRIFLIRSFMKTHRLTSRTRTRP
jgi:hypothetical protein